MNCVNVTLLLKYIYILYILRSRNECRSVFTSHRKSSPPASGQFTTSKMSAIVDCLVSYGSDSDSENESTSKTDVDIVDPMDPDATAHLKPLDTDPTMTVALLNSAPEVAVKVS